MGMLVKWIHQRYPMDILTHVLLADCSKHSIRNKMLFDFVAARQYNIPRFTDDAMDVINDPEVDAVWICSPSQYHAEQIKAAAANKKHVFCEKPIATDLAETVEAINACNEAGVKLMIGLQRRFDQNFERVKRAVEKKEVGDPIMVRR